MNPKFSSVLLALGVLTCSAAELHTWNFVHDGCLTNTETRAHISFKAKGRFDATFIRLEKTSTVILLNPLDAKLYSLQLTNLVREDLDYLAAQSPADAATMQRFAEHQVEQAKARTAARLEALRLAQARAAQERETEEKARREQEARQAAERLARYAPLLNGKPATFTWSYYEARKAVQQVADAGALGYAPDAQRILVLTDELAAAKLSGFQNVVELKSHQITDLLNRLLDARVLDP